MSLGTGECHHGLPRNQDCQLCFDEVKARKESQVLRPMTEIEIFCLANPSVVFRFFDGEKHIFFTEMDCTLAKAKLTWIPLSMLSFYVSKGFKYLSEIPNEHWRGFEK